MWVENCSLSAFIRIDLLTKQRLNFYMLQKHGSKSIKRLLILWFIHGQDNLIIISLMPTFLQIVEITKTHFRRFLQTNV